MEIELKQGLPRNDYFVVAVPKFQLEEPLVPGQTKIRMVDPRTNNVTESVYIAQWDKMTEQEFMIASGFSILAYGCSPGYIVPKLREQYPQLKQDFLVQYWLLKNHNYERISRINIMATMGHTPGFGY